LPIAKLANCSGSLLQNTGRIVKSATVQESRGDISERLDAGKSEAFVVRVVAVRRRVLKHLLPPQ
jgi:hypothetical protein